MGTGAGGAPVSVMDGVSWRVLEAVDAPVDFAHVAVLLECGVESERCFECVWCLAAFAEVEVFG